MSIKVQPVLEDYISISKTLLLKEKSIKTSIVIQSLTLPVLSMAMVLLAKPIKPVNVIVAVALSAVWIFFYPKFFKKMMGRKVERLYKKKNDLDANYLQEYVIEKIPEGLKAIRGDNEYTALYDSLDLYTVDEDHIYIIGGGFDFIIPARSFESREMFESMKNDIDRQIQIAIRK